MIASHRQALRIRQRELELSGEFIHSHPGYPSSFSGRATSTLPTRLLTDNKRPRICEIDPSQVFRESPASWSRQACSPRPEGRSVLQPDQRRHTPGATVAAIGKELLGLPDGAEAAAVNRLHPDPLQAL